MGPSWLKLSYEMAFSHKVILKSKGGDGARAFKERTIPLSKVASIKVGRAGKEDRPTESNAAFDCKVLSKNQASIQLNAEDHIVLEDLGSSNGSFVNNLRLSKPGQKSKQTRIFSGDVLRFGSQVYDKNS